MSKITTELFIEKAKLIHGDKYDYSKVEYNGCKHNIIILCLIHGEFEQRPDMHLRGYGCKNCSITKKKLTNKQFIEKAIQIYGNKYEYSKVEYKKSNEKIIIICKIHGEFLQTPGGHLSKRGCRLCGNIQKSLSMSSNTKDFIEKAKIKHGDKYNYSKVNYINNTKKIIIICKVHGNFLQSPSDHLNYNGCQICGNNKKGVYQQSNSIEFIEKAIKIHGDKYNYSKVEYIEAKIKVVIICNIHGPFLQRPYSHLRGTNCFKCTGTPKLNTNEFIKKAINIHNNKYDYILVNYKGCDKKVIIICKDHGKFKQTPNNHINHKQGCLKCTNNFSKAQIIWLELLSKLNNIYIQHAMNDGEFKIPTTNFKADGYCKDTNTIYEFHGDYWHGNPKIFDQDSMNKTCNMTHGELYDKTLKKEQIIKDLGYNLITIWESDWIKINKSIKKIQNKFKSNK